MCHEKLHLNELNQQTCVTNKWVMRNTKTSDVPRKAAFKCNESKDMYHEQMSNAEHKDKWCAMEKLSHVPRNTRVVHSRLWISSSLLVRRAHTLCCITTKQKTSHVPQKKTSYVPRTNQSYTGQSVNTSSLLARHAHTRCFITTKQQMSHVPHKKKSHVTPTNESYTGQSLNIEQTTR